MSTTSGEVDPMRHYLLWEERLKTVCNAQRETVHKILELKRGNKVLDQTEQAGLQRLVRQGLLLNADLKQCNREIQYAADEQEKSLQPYRSKVDDRNLELHNHLYEALQFRKAITGCRNFRSRDPEVNPIPEAEYFALRPEETALAASNPHQLMLNRLHYELTQRRTLETQVNALRHERETVNKSKDVTQKFLDELKGHLKGIKESTKPLQDFMHVPVRARNKQHERASALPVPLYVLYNKWTAFAATFPEERVVVDIHGHAREAALFSRERREQVQAYQRAQAKQAQTTGDGEEEGEEMDDAPRSKKRRVDSAPKVKQMNHYELHPLTVVVSFPVGDGADGTGMFDLRFHFMPLVRQIAVDLAPSKPPKEKESSKGSKQAAPATATPAGAFNWVDGVRALCNLFPGDAGKIVPNPINLFLPPHTGQTSSRFPFKWAQWCGGLDFDFPIPHNGQDNGDLFSSAAEVAICRQRETMRAVFRKIKHRLESRIVFFKQVEWLRKREFGGIKLLDEPPFKWQSLDPIRLASFEEAIPPEAGGVVVLEQWPKQYNAILETRGKDAQRFEVTFTVQGDYPNTPSLVSIVGVPNPKRKQPAAALPGPLKSLADPEAVEFVGKQEMRTTSNALRNIEFEVNANMAAHCADLTDGWLLTRQVLLTMRCLDIMLHAETDKTERLCIRSHRGRDRSLPFLWNQTLQMFEHSSINSDA
eukprot:TRINITY_DN82024_c0_g1_i1.p1 TRINITY_DN82024_c0_g1~~TRINITY_DN82024_c0_g1_i1.p1  ORF type:complete len:713 (-),score=121.77 TRINITY_DN82024_c0_g1_i1:13-2130(-)